MKQFDFYAKRKIFYSISIGLMIVAAAFLFISGVTLDIQFKGGTIVTYSYEGELDKAKFQSTVEATIDGRVSVQESTDVVTSAKHVTVSLAEAKGVSAEKMTELDTKLLSDFPENNIQTVSSNSVDPTIGHEFLLKCLVAMAFAAVLMVIYVALRFRVIGGWSAGITAVIALIHDVVVIFSVFVIFRIPIDGNFIAVVLTILGYSLNDTIVIYDRVRENKHLNGGKTPFPQLMNQSIWQCMARTMATSFTTITSMVIVCVVAMIFRVDSIISFAFPLTIGLVSGTYSSLCIAGPLWVQWNEYKLAKKKRA